MFDNKSGPTGALGPKEVGDWGMDKASQGVVRKVNPLTTFFRPERYQDNPAKAKVATQFQTLAYSLERDIEDGAEKSTAIRKLVEAQDCIFRAIDLNPDF